MASPSGRSRPWLGEGNERDADSRRVVPPAKRRSTAARCGAQPLLPASLTATSGAHGAPPIGPRPDYATRGRVVVNPLQEGRRSVPRPGARGSFVDGFGDQLIQRARVSPLVRRFAGPGIDDGAV